MGSLCWTLVMCQVLVARGLHRSCLSSSHPHSQAVKIYVVGTLGQKAQGPWVHTEAEPNRTLEVVREGIEVKWNLGDEQGVKGRSSLGPGQEAVGQVLAEEMRGCGHCESTVWQGELKEVLKCLLPQECGRRWSYQGGRSQAPQTFHIISFTVRSWKSVKVWKYGIGVLTFEIGFVEEWIVGWPGWNWEDQLGGDHRSPGEGQYRLRWGRQHQK